VETWHSYVPASLFCTHLTCNVHSSVARWCVVWNRWSVVYVYEETVNIWRSLCRIQLTYCIFNILVLWNRGKQTKREEKTDLYIGHRCGNNLHNFSLYWGLRFSFWPLNLKSKKKINFSFNSKCHVYIIFSLCWFLICI
jgi:hypothetical protein